MKKDFYQIAAFCLLFFFMAAPRLFALDGNTNSHDPGALIKEGNKYWMFTTGKGIYAAYSEDLITWTSGPKTIFPIGTWPEWINEKVPGFAGDFWAPESFFMNGRYYMYYSCSTFGSPRSAIGVASSPTLDQNSPNFKWTDHGMVVASIDRTDINAIDPAIFQDDDGKVYMSYGSFFGGIGVVELDPNTGLRKAGAAIHTIAGGNHANYEAPYIFKDGGYYYLMVNRGSCCRGASSTYYIVMGRSTSINGPYTDKADLDMTTGGGTTVLNTSGKYIGPGHFGLLRENGFNHVSLHYYDGSDNGRAKLDIVNMGFDDQAWPFLTRDWIAKGRYKVTNQNSKLSWDSWGCTGRAGEPLAQGAYGGFTCQQWDLTPIGNGVFTIKSAQSGLALSLTPAANTAGCNTAWGAKLELATPANRDCQKFKIERAADGAYIFISLANNQVIEVPFASSDAGVQLGVWGHNGCKCQRWYINKTTEPDIVTKAINLAPANNTVLSYENVKLGWSGNAQTFYQVYMGSSPANLTLVAANVTGTSYSLPATPALGTYYWRVDAVLNGQLATGDVWSFTLEDKVAPTVAVQNLTLTLNASGTASLDPANLNQGSFDAYGIAGFSVDKASFDCSNLGDNAVMVTVTDKNGNSASAPATVTVLGSIPSPSISVSRTDNTFTGGSATTIFLGYGAQDLVLTASNANASGATTFQWSAVAGLSQTSGAAVTFAPRSAGTYTLTATATNEFGCTAVSAPVTVTVIDVRCVGNPGKVQMCHNGKRDHDICMDVVSVQDHLAHGCSLGTCANAPVATSVASSSALQVGAPTTGSLTSYPNPASSQATIYFSLPNATNYSLHLYDSNGRWVETLQAGSVSANEQVQVNLQAKKYPVGLYLLQLVSDQEVITKRLVLKE